MARITKNNGRSVFPETGIFFQTYRKTCKSDSGKGGREELCRVYGHINIRQDTSDVSFTPLSFLNEKWKQTKDKMRIVTCKIDILL
jgi:hypothetical protein